VTQPKIQYITVSLHISFHHNVLLLLALRCAEGVNTVNSEYSQAILPHDAFWLSTSPWRHIQISLIIYVYHFQSFSYVTVYTATKAF